MNMRNLVYIKIIKLSMQFALTIYYLQKGNYIFKAFFKVLGNAWFLKVNLNFIFNRGNSLED